MLIKRKVLEKPRLGGYLPGIVTGRVTAAEGLPALPAFACDVSGLPARLALGVPPGELLSFTTNFFGLTLPASVISLSLPELAPRFERSLSLPLSEICASEDLREGS